MKINKDKVRKIAELSRLKLEESDIEEYALQMNKILDYVEQLDKLDTGNIEPTSHVLQLKNVTRQDKTTPSLDRHDALMNAPDHTDKFYRVPKIIE
ncbi:MAG: Asp-tRNA(Asn)/Glu-tRNA(Gln) amidotransferase subunit GatC [Dissulfurispiraceae bacterium]|jgi:aspartyl-tRNA(Asn)/glutamyl-tRNA(Gln) amidotransferase subunit C|nr:Asp-tRNA(Asn)/Glu-tRNA(Gln) amidotransferase subunit GatC [Dissulfurispiraceae bacterium]